MEDKIDLTEIMALIDNNAKSAWDDFTEEQKKIVKKDFFILNRWISCVQGNNRELSEHYVLTVNEYYNKYWNIIPKNRDTRSSRSDIINSLREDHSQLLWMLLCTCAHESKSIQRHGWISNKRGSSKTMNFLEKIYPTHKIADLEVLNSVMTLSDFKQLAKDHGYEDKQIKKMF